MSYKKECQFCKQEIIMTEKLGKWFPLSINNTPHVCLGSTHRNDRIQKFTNTGTFIREWGDDGTGNGQINGPVGVSIDSKGNVFVADNGNDRIQKFSNTGKFIRKWSGSGGGGNITSLSPSSVPMLGLATGAPLQ
jgi:hypothetical protein